jgi:hypothetical protein
MLFMINLTSDPYPLVFRAETSKTKSNYITKTLNIKLQNINFATILNTH